MLADWSMKLNVWFLWWVLNRDMKRGIPPAWVARFESSRWKISLNKKRVCEFKPRVGNDNGNGCVFFFFSTSCYFLNIDNTLREKKGQLLSNQVLELMLLSESETAPVEITGNAQHSAGSKWNRSVFAALIDKENILKNCLLQTWRDTWPHCTIHVSLISTTVPDTDTQRHKWQLVQGWDKQFNVI